jgi:hypothetical protein
MSNAYIWLGIVFCLTQSATFSGLNLAFFTLSRLRLEAEASSGSKAAKKILIMRRDSNFLLTTILWGNVGINVLLTLLSNSVLAGVSAFAFSTVVITFAGEIFPQAYFSRRAMTMAALFSPVLRFYQFLLYPVAKPSAWMLDKWLGIEHIEFLREHHLKQVIEQHIQSESAEVDEVEGIGALNFLDIDEIPISEEGEVVDPSSVLTLPSTIDLPVFPNIDRSAADPFIKSVNRSGKKWVILADTDGIPRLVLDSDAYLRAALIDDGPLDGYQYCHRPIIIDKAKTPLDKVIVDLKRGISTEKDQAIDKDIILLWTKNEKRVITGADILGRLLRGIG